MLPLLTHATQLKGLYLNGFLQKLLPKLTQLTDVEYPEYSLLEPSDKTRTRHKHEHGSCRVRPKIFRVRVVFVFKVHESCRVRFVFVFKVHESCCVRVVLG